MAVEMISGATGTKNIAPNLRISEMSWPVISKKRKIKKSKKRGK